MKGFFRKEFVPHAAPLLVLCLVAMTVYARLPGHDLQLFWNDDKYIVSNAMICGFSFSHLKSAFNSFYFGNYAPLHLLSYMLDYSLWGLNPTGFFQTNCLIHLSNGLIFHALLVRGGMERFPAFSPPLYMLLEDTLAHDDNNLPQSYRAET